MGARRQLPHRAPGAGGCGRHLHIGGGGLRIDEAAHPQRRPCGDRLSRRADGHPLRARCHGRSAGAGLPRQAGGGGDHPPCAAGAGRRPASLLPHHRAALRQSGCGRHHSAPRAGRLQPAAEIHPALDPRPAEGRRRRDGAGARIRFVVPLLRRHHRYGRRGAARRSECGPARAPGAGGEGRSGQVPGPARHLRRCRRCAAVPRAFRGRPEQPVARTARAQRCSAI